jgi:hypothetical protein
MLDWCTIQVRALQFEYSRKILVMFEITADDIALLNDEYLRTLVGLLCELEVKSRGLPTSTVTWGGNQNAADGGVDVRVALPAQTVIEGFVPRPATVFQVKTEEMPPSKIDSEMRSHGSIRPVIRELAAMSGAYIIVSSKSATTDPAIQNRRDAMAEAARDVPNYAALFLDFYDVGRVATWTRNHPNLILWVREKIGRAFQGWRPFGAWAYPAEGSKAEYLLDGNIRIQTGKHKDGGGFDVVQGINHVRSLLSEPRNVVRLIGLSGVGKTRFVQALFDDRVGEHPLDASLAIYTDMADAPDPPPVGVASDLVASQEREILIIDNCSPELHGRLTKLCQAPESMLSVITVEYDIQEDQPEGTEVFRLEPSSIDLVEKLVKYRFPEVSVVDARTVAEFSGGNARIAIALGKTLGKIDTIAGLSEADLFERLFRQRHPHDKSLLVSAQGCSLVYSFQGENVSGDRECELGTLGAVVGQTAPEVYGNVAELHRRGLVQRRSVWRAVLPQAIANRLAATALQNIPADQIENRICNSSERLLRSFSRRLGYLHASNEATPIVRKWLGSGGKLGEVAALNDLGRAMLQNVAPAAPEAALAALERAVLGQEGDEALQRCDHYVRLLRSLAYDADLFDRCVAVMLKLAEAGDLSAQSNEARGAFASLFTIYLSGTHAPIEQRLQIIETLLLSDNAKRRGLGLLALKAALESWHFGSHYNFEFGAHSRDHGYWPRTENDVKHWFGSTIKLSEIVACSDGPSASEVCVALAEKFRGLWTKATMYDELEHVCRSISGKQFWREGWIAVRETIRFDSEGFTPELSDRLSSLEELLRPRNLVENVRSVVFTRRQDAVYIDDVGQDGTNWQARFERTMAIAHDLGKTVATDEGAFAELLKESVSVEVSGDGRLWQFGRGLAEGADPNAIWNRLVKQLAATSENQRNIQVLRGFLDGVHERNPGLANALLDDALTNETLAPWYPFLEASVPCGDQGLDRLMRSLALGKAPIGSYAHLLWGGAGASIPGKAYRELVLQIASKPDGFDVAIALLHPRLTPNKEGEGNFDPEIVDAGCELLRQIPFTERKTRDDYNLGLTAKACLVGERGAAIVSEICRRLRHAVSKFEAHAYEYLYLLEGLFAVQPSPTLDGIFGAGDEEIRAGVLIIRTSQQHRKNPLDLVPEGEIITWCDKDPKTRYPAIASVITIAREAKGTDPLRWTDVALRILDRAPDRVDLLKQIVERFRPTAWVGSRAAIIGRFSKLLDDLDGYPDAAVVEFVGQQKVQLAKEIEAELHREADFYRQNDEQFE